MTSDAADLRALLIHDAFLRRLAGRLVDASSADDVVQDTWLTALRRAPREAVAAKAWLAQVARNFAAMDFRARERAARREAAAARPEAAPSAEEIVEREGVRRDVVEALLRLDALYRDALLLRYERDVPPRRVAAALGVPVETARSRIKRGLELLRAELTSRRGADRWRSAVGLLLAQTAPRASAATASAAIGVALLTVVGAFRVFGSADESAVDPPTRVSPPFNRPTAAVPSGAAAASTVARQPFSGPGFRIVSDEEMSEAFPCAEPTDAEGRPRLIATRVVDLLTGRPLPGAVVALEEESHAPLGEPPRPLRTATADADGWVRIRVDDLHDRPYGFFVSAEGRATVADFGSRLSCPVELPPPRSRRVRAVDARGAPLSGLRLDFVLGCGHHATRARYLTDADGEAEIGGLGTEGGYLWPVDGHVVTDEFDVDAATTDDEPPLTLPCVATTAVRGRVVRGGIPVPGVFVGSPHRHRGPWSKTDSDGRFELLGAPSDEALLVREAPPQADLGRPRAAPRDLGESDRPPVGREVVIDLARRGFDETEPSVEVEALCLDASGAAVAGVALCAYGADGDVFRAASDRFGVARLRLFHGRYELATDDARSAATVEPLSFDVIAAVGAPQALTCRVSPRARSASVEGPPPTGVVDEQGGDEPTAATSRVVASVSAADGRPIVGAAVAFATADVAHPRFATARTDTEGRIRAADVGSGGSMIFAVRADGFAPYFATSEGDAAPRLVLPAGAVEVRVGDEADAPLTHATVLIDGEALYLRAGAAFSVSLRGLAGGRHEAIVAAPGRIARRIVFELDDGATAELSARLRRTL